MFSNFKANTRLIFSTVSKRLENNCLRQCSSKYHHVITRDNKISSTDNSDRLAPAIRRGQRMSDNGGWMRSCVYVHGLPMHTIRITRTRYRRNYCN